MHAMTMELATAVGRYFDGTVSAIRSVDGKREAVILAFSDDHLEGEAYLIRIDRLGIPE